MLFTSSVYPCTWWGEPYYIADENHFELKEYVNKKVTEQGYLSSRQYFDERFGSNNWELRPDTYEIDAPDVVEDIQNIRITIRSTTNREVPSKVYILAELYSNNKYAYVDLTQMTIQPTIKEVATSINIPDTVNIFVVEATINDKTVISGSKQIKKNPGCGYIRVRTQSEANDLNKKICDKIHHQNKSNEQACIELKKHVLLENNS